MDGTIIFGNFHPPFAWCGLHSLFRRAFLSSVPCSSMAVYISRYTPLSIPWLPLFFYTLFLTSFRFIMELISPIQLWYFIDFLILPFHVCEISLGKSTLFLFRYLLGFDLFCNLTQIHMPHMVSVCQTRSLPPATFSCTSLSKSLALSYVLSPISPYSRLSSVRLHPCRAIE